MREVKVQLNECKAGDTVTRDIIEIRSGTVLCSEGCVLNEEILRWLNKFECTDIYILNDAWDKVWDLKQKSLIAYDENKILLKNILMDVKNNKNINTDSITNIRNNFFEQLNSNSTIIGCVNRIKAVDEYTYSHCMNVGMLAVAIGKWLKLAKEDLDRLFLAGILHDVGKYKIDLNILNKKGVLTDSEFEEIKKHTIYGWQAINSLNGIDSTILEGVLSHHEKIDGSGYPRGLKSEEIPLFGKIIAVADVYDAMISERSYKKKMTPFVVMEKMYKESFNKLDTDILLTFLNNIASYYIGIRVLLSNGQIGEVVFVHPQCVYAAIIKVGEQYIDLYERKDITILDIT